MTRPSRPRPDLDRVRAAGKPIRVLAWALAIGTLAFAVVNVVFEMSGRFDEGPLSEYSTGLSVANWFVVFVKVMGAGVALLCVTTRPRVAARTVNVLIWGAAGVLGIYAIGSLGQAIGLAASNGGPAGSIDLAGVAYVSLFLAAAAGYTALSVSHTRRSGLGPGPAVLGVIGGLVLLGTIFLVLPMLLSALEIMPPT